MGFFSLHRFQNIPKESTKGKHAPYKFQVQSHQNSNWFLCDFEIVTGLAFPVILFLRFPVLPPPHDIRLFFFFLNRKRRINISLEKEKATHQEVKSFSIRTSLKMRS